MLCESHCPTVYSFANEEWPAPSDHALFGPLPHPDPFARREQGHFISLTLTDSGGIGGCSCFSEKLLVFPSCLHPCPLRVASQLPLLEVASISTHTGRGLWEAVT